MERAENKCSWGLDLPAGSRGHLGGGDVVLWPQEEPKKHRGQADEECRFIQPKLQVYKGLRKGRVRGRFSGHSFTQGWQCDWMKGTPNPVDLPIIAEIRFYIQDWKPHPRPGQTHVLGHARQVAGRYPRDGFPHSAIGSWLSGCRRVCPQSFLPAVQVTTSCHTSLFPLWRRR